MTVEPKARALSEVVLDQLSTTESRAYKMWLPPLKDPTPLNELVERDDRQPLRFALGIMDEPRRHLQGVWGVDVSGAGGNIAIGGAPQTGKSTLLQTMMLSAAATHTPRQVQFYCIDLGGGGLIYLDNLPHVGGVATRSEPDRVMRVIAEVQAVLRQREATFKEHRVGSIAMYRQLRADPNQPVAADPFGDVFLVIDGWPAFVSEFPDLETPVQELASQGLSFGVHTVITTPRWTELKSRVRDYLGTKIEFRLGDVNDTQIDRATRDIPANRPGRAMSVEKHHLMIGVPRFDGVHSANDLVEAITAALNQVAAQHIDRAPRVRVLPER
ncbi:MAG: type VII secretion protein EccCb, partial [Mycobacterium sp.]|uniref:type VII secretion protein EccCb n=1 Tax=Mycobacterium sp. TaxID=1785 RepID=UPI001EBA0ECB